MTTLAEAMEKWPVGSVWKPKLEIWLGKTRPLRRVQRVRIGADGDVVIQYEDLTPGKRHSLRDGCCTLRTWQAWCGGPAE